MIKFEIHPVGIEDRPSRYDITVVNGNQITPLIAIPTVRYFNLKDTQSTPNPQTGKVRFNDEEQIFSLVERLNKLWGYESEILLKNRLYK